MKKWNVIFGLILFSFSAHSFAFLPTSFPKRANVPVKPGGVSAGITGLYWDATVPQLDFALTFPTVNAAGDPVFNDGVFHSIDPHRKLAYRLDVGTELPCSGFDINLAYTDYRNRTHGLVANPIDFNLFASLSVNPLTGTANSFNFDGAPIPIDFAIAYADFRYMAVDLKLDQHIRYGCHLLLTPFIGIRHLEIANKLVAAYQTNFIMQDTPPLNLLFLLNTNQKSFFNGYGPRVGINARYTLLGPIALVSEFSSALIVGRIRSTFNDTLDFFVLGERDELQSFISYASPKERRIVPNLEGELSLSFSHAFCYPGTGFELSVGYQITHYWNTVDRLSFNLPQTLGFNAREVMDTGFAGPIASLHLYF